MCACVCVCVCVYIPIHFHGLLKFNDAKMVEENKLYFDNPGTLGHTIWYVCQPNSLESLMTSFCLSFQPMTPEMIGKMRSLNFLNY